jgi:hypothetical protein
MLKENAFDTFHTSLLRPESINWLPLAYCVPPSLTILVQEYQPVVHRLRLSASP